MSDASDRPEAYRELMIHLREAATLASVAELLGWDQETTMPAAASGFRAEELALISRLTHQRATSPRLGELLGRCESEPTIQDDLEAAANLREIRRDYDRASRLPEDLVAEISETNSRGMEAWKQARSANDFNYFLPWLEKQIRLNRRKAECVGFPPDGNRYDALLEDFEPGTTGASIEEIFRPLRQELTPLIEAVAVSRYRPDTTVHRMKLPLERQIEFNRRLLGGVGFDLEAGRLDVSAHPFSSGIAPGDTRITTRYREDHILDALGSTLHEAGHALYEQGLPKLEHHGQPLAEPISLGIHESQSRLWENQVGRSRAFWVWALPEAHRVFGTAFDGLTGDSLYEASNIVEPNLIRVDSDEATYNLHIMLRFDLERAMVLGDLAAKDLPGAWNERIQKDLGLVVPDDSRGCLQDVHWSMGAFGYFPSYTMGNLYGAQFWDSANAAIPDLEEQIAEGRFEILLRWLRKNIHGHGRRFPAAELCRRVTGKPLSHQPLMRYLDTKFRAVYRIAGSNPSRSD